MTKNLPLFLPMMMMRGKSPHHFDTLMVLNIPIRADHLLGDDVDDAAADDDDANTCDDAYTCTAT